MQNRRKLNEGNRFTDRIENPLGKPRKKSKKTFTFVSVFLRFLFPSFLVLLVTTTTKFVACSAVACVAANPSVTAIAISIYIYTLCSIHTYI